MKGMSRSPLQNIDPSSSFTATVPTPEQTYDALAPDLKKKVDAARAARQARENVTTEQIQAQASPPFIRHMLSVETYHLSPPADERPRFSKACVVKLPTSFLIVPPPVVRPLTYDLYEYNAWLATVIEGP